MKREKASTQDLDAVKELLGTKASPRPTSASMPAQKWEPVLSTGSRPGQGRGGMGAMFRSPILRGAIAAILLGVVALVAYAAYTGQARRASSAAAVVGPPPIPSAPAGTPAPTNPAVLSSPPPAQAMTATATASLSPPATAVQTMTPIPPTAPLADKPSPTPTPKAAPTSTPTPAVVAKIAPASKGSGSGYEALKGGHLAEASSNFEAVAQGHASEFSVQILVACSAQTIAKALQNDASPDLFTLPATISGKPCHRLMRGFFTTSADATQSVATLPAYYVAEGAKPKAVLVRSVLP